MGIIQVGVLGVAGVLLAVQFKGGKSEYGIYISIALSLLIFFAILSQLKEMLAMIKTIGSYIKLDTVYIGILFKILGITYVAEFSSSICRDAGYQTIAQQIEIFGKMAILVLSTPVLLALLDAIKEFLS